MTDFTLSLALFDFLPVLFTGLAVYWIAAMAQTSDTEQSYLPFLGAALVFGAGALKATWKLTVTLTQQDISWMANALFLLMAPGFVLLVVGLWEQRRRLAGKTMPIWGWSVAWLLIVLTYGLAAYRTWLAPVERGWFMPMMSLASLGNITLTILLFMTAWGQGKRGLAFLFTVNLAMVFALIPIAQVAHKSIALHWFEEALTTFGAACFAVAAYRLYQLLALAHTRAHTRDHTQERVRTVGLPVAR